MLKCILCVIVASIIGVMLIHCGIEGSYPIPGPVGARGSDGSDGRNGSSGKSGINSVIQVLNVSSCPNGGVTILTATDSNRNGFPDSGDSGFQTSELCNGIDGTNSVFDIAELYDPCGDNVNVIDERFIKVTDNGITKYLASFSNNAGGDYTRFALLEPGSYQTTDSATSPCKFTVDADYNIINEHY